MKTPPSEPNNKRGPAKGQGGRPPGSKGPEKVRVVSRVSREASERLEELAKSHGVTQSQIMEAILPPAGGLKFAGPDKVISISQRLRIRKITDEGKEVPLTVLDPWPAFENKAAAEEWCRREKWIWDPENWVFSYGISIPEKLIKVL